MISIFTCVVAVDAIDDRLLPDAEVLALLVDEVHGIVEAPVAHGDGPHGARLQQDIECVLGPREVGRLTIYPSI